MPRLALLFALLIATPAAAFDRVTNRTAFLTLISDKTLSNRLYQISLTVSPSGVITGEALGWDVTGNWTWKNGFFCRDMTWGGDALPYNCQLVETRDNRELRFTSDQGQGESASFKLR